MPLRDTTHRPTRTRPCAVAGRFYPSAPNQLSDDIQRYLEDAPVCREQDPIPPENIRAIIVPHAGYPFSAPVAASAYRSLQSRCGRIHQIVLIGPAHYARFSGLGVSSADAFDSPLGAVPIDTAAVQALTDGGKVGIQDEAHAPEHGLEVHLPLLIHTLTELPDSGPGFTILPLLFSEVSYEQTAEVLDPFLDDPSTLIVVSSDLSHYQDYNTATQVDRMTAEAIVSGRTAFITPDRACGHTAVRALMACADRRGLKTRLLDLRNSGDTAGPRDQVVGYGSFLTHEPGPATGGAR